jgi:hypothetical protein
MAQRTGAERFLAPAARTASAGIVLALAVAALALAGCGGGSSDGSSSTATSADATASPGSGSGASGGETANVKGHGASGHGTAGEGASGGGPTNAGGQPSTGGKHGAHVPQPSGAPEPGITPQQRREATVASMTLQSPSSRSSNAGPQVLPAEFTCDGKNTSPALSWQGVPQGTAELVVLAMNLQPVEGKLFFDWAVAGLSPDLTEIAAGKLPKGAVVGRNGFGKVGYEVCPPGGGETYMFTVFALPKKLSPARGFDPSVLRREVLEASGNVGLLALSYTRG